MVVAWWHTTLFVWAAAVHITWHQLLET